MRRGLEMDTVEGAREDSACLLTLLPPPGRLQLALPLERPPGASRTPRRASGPSSAPTGRAACSALILTETAPSSPTRRRSPLTGEGPRDEAVLTAIPAQRPEGACERNHVEIIRKLLSQGRWNSPDRFSPRPIWRWPCRIELRARGASGFTTPARAFEGDAREDAAALLDAAWRDVPSNDLDLTPGLIEGRAAGAMPAG